MSAFFLGIDTSNYRTSVAAVDESGRILAQKAVLLEVPAGKRGLRQSEAFYAHSCRLPSYLEEIFRAIDPASLIAVGVSERPRRVEGSYMPCFNAGVNAARSIGAALKVPVYFFSHQEGHAAAVLESDGAEPPGRSVFFHLSGGTTEALLCSPDENGYDMTIAGGTLDISTGQLLDRYGVALGLPFPSGSYLDDAAYGYFSEHGLDADVRAASGIMPVIKINDGYFNLSGAETRLLGYARARDTHDGPAADAVTAEVFSCITDLLLKEARYLSDKYSISRIHLAGGVASSRTVRALAASRSDMDIRFGAPELSGDNAVGTALLAKRINETGKCISGK